MPLNMLINGIAVPILHI
uniref:Uncharacterized protein n=1 Tax=Anguilla anguilla TaxID=7936 RepID=A0A0E9QFU8_ANGAN